MITLLPIFMALTSRASGGGLWAKIIPYKDEKNKARYLVNSLYKRSHEIMFSAPFAYYTYEKTGNPYLSALTWAWCYFMMELGHGTFYAMTGYVHSIKDGKDRIQTIEKVFRPLYRKAFRRPIEHPAYSWFMMSIKGTLIALPLGFISPVVGVLWAACYYIGFRIEKHNYYAEYLTGAMSACFILMGLL